jgi:hypothetical protein
MVDNRRTAKPHRLPWFFTSLYNDTLLQRKAERGSSLLLLIDSFSELFRDRLAGV